MQENNKKPDDSLYPSGHTGVPVEDSLSQNGLAKKVKKHTSPKSPSRKARKRDVSSETFDSSKFHRALIRSIQESSKKGKSTRRSRDPSRSGSFRRVGFRSVGILSIIICTILVTSAYASLGPRIVNDDLTNVVNEVLSFTKNKYTQYRIQVARDHSPPVISGLNDLVIEATGALTAVPLARPIVTDNVDPTPTVINNASSAGYPLGTNSVIWKARDDAGNIATALQKVTIVDTTPPIVTAPADVVAEIDSVSYYAQLSIGTAYVKDEVDSSPFVTNDIPIGGFPEGITVVTWTATDVSGNSAQDTQLVSVIVQGLGLDDAAADPSSSTDATNSSSIESSSTDSSSGSYSFGGGGGGSGSTSSSDSESVLDITPPLIIPPPFIIANATGPATLVELGWPEVSDAEDPDPIVTNNAPADGFPLGTTIITWIATDDAGNYATAEQVVTIQSTGLPSLSIPSDITIEAANSNGAVLSYNVSGSDVIDGSIAPICSPASGSTFSLGSTQVICTLINSRGNSISDSFSVMVQDTTPPALTLLADIVLEATEIPISITLDPPIAVDLVDPSPTITNDAPAGGFLTGNTTVTWTAVDHYGNSVSITQLVAVSDANIFDVTEFGAIPNDSTDDTKGIAAAIKNALIKTNLESGSTAAVYVPDGTFEVNETFYIDYGKNIIINGPGTLKMTTISDNIFHIKHSHDITIKDITLQGWQDGTADEFDSGGNLIYGSAIRVTDNSNNITIKDCKIFNHNLSGITMSQVSGINIGNCEIFNTRTSIRLETVSDATISNNYLHDQRADGVYVFGISPFQDIDITNNSIEWFGDTAIDITGAGANINITKNAVHDAYPNTNNLHKVDPNGLGLSISSTIANFQVISNKIAGVSVGMSLDGKMGTISNNEVSYNGISADWTHLLVQNRYVVDMGSYNAFEQFGMSVGGSNLEISGNTITSPSHVMKPVGWDLNLNKIRNYGIKVFASNNLISDNSFSLYTDKIPAEQNSETANVLNYGIKIGGSASGVTVDSNTLHLMPGASYDSIIEKGTSNTLCTQQDNIILADGSTVSLIKGFLAI